MGHITRYVKFKLKLSGVQVIRCTSFNNRHTRALPNIPSLGIEYGNMSRSGRPRKIKQLNPGEQPPLSKFITGSPRDSTESKSVDSKKRRKPIAKKRADSINDPPSPKKVPSELNTKDNKHCQQDVENKSAGV